MTGTVFRGLTVLLLVTACGGQQGLTPAQAQPATAAATATPTPVPTPEVVQPITLSGTGSKVLDPIEVPKGFWRVSWKAETTGRSVNFTVRTHGQEDTLVVNALLPNTTSGESSFNSAGGRFVFTIEASEIGQTTWTITLTRVSA
jgi:hypothetical protein